MKKYLDFIKITGLCLIAAPIVIVIFASHVIFDHD